MTRGGEEHPHTHEGIFSWHGFRGPSLTMATILVIDDEEDDSCIAPLRA